MVILYITVVAGMGRLELGLNAFELWRRETHILDTFYLSQLVFIPWPFPTKFLSLHVRSLLLPQLTTIGSEACFLIHVEENRAAMIEAVQIW